MTDRKPDRIDKALDRETVHKKAPVTAPGQPTSPPAPGVSQGGPQGDEIYQLAKETATARDA